MENFNGIKDLANGITAEEMTAFYFNFDALREAPRTVYRLGGTNQRVYYTIDQSGEPSFYSSVTDFIKKSMPTSPHLIKWIADMGIEESKAYAQDRADYGTFMHIECGTLLITRKLDLDSMRDRLLAYIEEKKLPQDFVNYVDELKKDLLAFAQWVIDYKVKPLAVEIVLASDELGVAGAIDLPCELTIERKGFFGEEYKSGPQKGMPKESKQEFRIRAIVDFKSGRKGFYEEHELQLETYRMMWNEEFPDLPIDDIFNWSPKDWRGPVPTYNFKDQTASRSLEKLPYLIKIGIIERKRGERNILITQGEINLDNPDLSSNLMAMNLSELVKLGFND
jgi:hypothetical protein